MLSGYLGRNDDEMLKDAKEFVNYDLVSRNITSEQRMTDIIFFLGIG